MTSRRHFLFLAALLLAAHATAVGWRGDAWKPFSPTILGKKIRDILDQQSGTAF